MRLKKYDGQECCDPRQWPTSANSLAKGKHLATTYDQPALLGGNKVVTACTLVPATICLRVTLLNDTNQWAGTKRQEESGVIHLPALLTVLTWDAGSNSKEGERGWMVQNISDGGKSMVEVCGRGRRLAQPDNHDKLDSRVGENSLNIPRMVVGNRENAAVFINTVK